jgi:hypothetical protein
MYGARARKGERSNQGSGEGTNAGAGPMQARGMDQLITSKWRLTEKTLGVRSWVNPNPMEKL